MNDTALILVGHGAAGRGEVKKYTKNNDMFTIAID